MEPKFKSSFIPKQSLDKVTGKKKKKGGVISVVPVAALIIFIGTVALGVGVFLYQQFLIQNIDRKEQALESALNELRTPLIEEFVRLDNRLKSAEVVLNNHIILSAFFDLLEEKTLSNVQFSNFSYEASEDGVIEVSMNGVARSFNAVAVQAEVFGEDHLIQNPVFSGLNTDHSGNVVFSFNASIDSRLLSYTLAVGGGESVDSSQDLVE